MHHIDVLVVISMANSLDSLHPNLSTQDKSIYEYSHSDHVCDSFSHQKRQ